MSMLSTSRQARNRTARTGVLSALLLGLAIVGSPATAVADHRDNGKRLCQQEYDVRFTHVGQVPIRGGDIRLGHISVNSRIVRGRRGDFLRLCVVTIRRFHGARTTAIKIKRRTERHWHWDGDDSYTRYAGPRARGMYLNADAQCLIVVGRIGIWKERFRICTPDVVPVRNSRRPALEDLRSQLLAQQAAG